MTDLSDEMKLAFAKSEGGLLVYAAAFITMLRPHGPDDPSQQYLDCVALLERLAGIDTGEVEKRVKDHTASNNLDQAVNEVIDDGFDAAARGAMAYVSHYLYDLAHDGEDDAEAEDEEG